MPRAPALLLLLLLLLAASALPGARGFTAARGACRPVVCALHTAASGSGTPTRTLDKRAYKRAFQLPNHPDKGGELETSQFFNDCGRELFGSGSGGGGDGGVVSCGSGVEYARIDRAGVVRAYEAEQRRNAARRAAKEKASAPPAAPAAAAGGGWASWWRKAVTPKKAEQAAARCEAEAAAARAEAEMADANTREIVEAAAAAARRVARREREAAAKAAAAERARAEAAAHAAAAAAAAAAASQRRLLAQRALALGALLLVYRLLAAPRKARAPAGAVASVSASASADVIDLCGTDDDGGDVSGARGGVAVCEAQQQAAQADDEYLDEEDHMYALWTEELARRDREAHRAAPAPA
jgi:chemotaxis protein histidine kinase CheA